MEYTLQTLRSNTVFADRDAAVEFLDTFRYHMNGQPVCVRYYDPLDHNNYQCLFAVGLKNGNGEDAGPEYYHIIEGGTLEQVQSDWTQTDATQPDFIQHKPDLAAVATSGSYNDLTDTPELADIATTGSYNDLRDVPLGDAGGIAELDSNGKVPSSQLPSFVDDVIEAYYNTSTDRFYEEPEFITLITPSAGKSWVDISTNKSYRWTGSVYVRVDEGVQLGVTADTAYRGDRGKIAYDHATDANRNTTAQTKKLYKMSVTSEGHVGQVEESTAETDIVNLQENVEYLDNGLFKGGWRTPTADELAYIINTRPASTVSGTTNARYAKAQVNNINGLILLPDVFTLPSGIIMNNINDSTAAFSGNTYAISQWETLENSGCVFLPAAGNRNGIYTYDVGSVGYYWTSSKNSDIYAWFFTFRDTFVNLGQCMYNGGCSVRLIQDDNTNGLFSIPNNTKCNIAKSNLQFHCLNKEWRFAPNSYDVIGNGNRNVAENYNGYIDLFGFGTSGWNSGAVAYQPWSTSTTNTDYINHDLTGDYRKSDWGVYNIKKQLHDVAFSGDYNDLENKPTIPAAQIQSDWAQTDNTAVDYIKNKPTLEPFVINYVGAGTTGYQHTIDKTAEQIYNAVQEGRVIKFQFSTSIYIFNPVICEKSSNNTYKIVFVSVDLRSNSAVSTNSVYISDSVAFFSNASSFNADWVAADNVYLSMRSGVNMINNAALKIQKNGVQIAQFTANSASNVTANITVPTQLSDLTNNIDWYGTQAEFEALQSYSETTNYHIETNPSTALPFKTYDKLIKYIAPEPFLHNAIG